MKYKVETIPAFDKALKKLVKKYLCLKEDITHLIHSLQQDPYKGQPLGKKIYKIRLAISSKNTGKSGGARVITFVTTIEERVVLLKIYDKSHLDNLSDNELKALHLQACSASK